MKLNRKVIFSLFFLVFIVGFVSATVNNVYIVPAYPTPSDTIVNAYADISGVSSADLIYQIAGDPTIHTTDFSGPFSGGFAGIVNGHPVNGVQVTYQIKTFDSLGNVVDLTTPANFFYDGTNPTATITRALSGYIVGGTDTATAICSDTMSGCQESKLYISSSPILDCSAISYSSYVSSPQTITTHSYVCAAAKDNAGNIGYSSPMEFTTFDKIQDAVNAAPSGTIINVMAGSYPESVIIDRGLILRGAVGAIISPIIGPGIQIDVSPVNNPVTINGFTITPQDSTLDSAQGIVIGRVDSPVATYGITISNNIITTQGRNMGILVRGVGTNGIGYPSSSGLTVTNNTITLNGDSTAFYASWVIPAHTNWTITDNTFDSPIGVNLQLYDVNGVTVNNNIFKMAGSGGSTSVFFDAELSNLNLPIIFSNNDVQGSGANLVSFKTEMEGTNTDVLNTMDNVTVTGNTFNNWVVAVDRQALGIYPRVTTVSIHQNKFLGSGWALRNLDTSQVNAENNWWGTFDGAIIPTLIQGNVDFDPWWITPTGGNDLLKPESQITLSGTQYITSSTFNLPYTASDNVGLKRIRLYENGPGPVTDYDSLTGYPLSHSGSFLRTVADGTYNYYTVAVDIRDTAYGGVEDAPLTPDITIIVDTSAPTLNIIAPPDSGTIDNMDYYLAEADTQDSGSGIARVNLTLTNSTGSTIFSNKNMSLGTSGNYEYLMSMWSLTAGDYTLKVDSTDNAGNSVSSSSSFTVQANVAPSDIIAVNSQVPISGGTVSFNFRVTIRGDNQVRFGMDNIAGLSPSAFNARISNGTTSVSVGDSAYTGAGLLILQDNDLITPNTQGNFTLSLDIPPNMIPGNYPINYYIGIV